MISTVTVSTVSIIATTSLAIQAGVMATLFLIALLIVKNILDASPNKNKLVGKWLYVGITPLLLGFITIVGVKIMELLA